LSRLETECEIQRSSSIGYIVIRDEFDACDAVARFVKLQFLFVLGGFAELACSNSFEYDSGYKGRGTNAYENFANEEFRIFGDTTIIIIAVTVA